MNLSHGKYFRVDFSGKDLRGVPMHHSTFTCCKFNDCDMTDVDASYSVFTAGSMKNTKCTRTNFMNSHLCLRFEPSDCLGMTLTLSCNTFKGMTISNIWWFGWLYFAFQMKPVNGSEVLHPALIKIIGEERFQRLDRMFKARQL